jgi:deoxycytidine triphosphate deaminase
VDFAASDEDAQARYEKWRSLDPFPDIPPALLNSADLQDYVSATGMITPFNPDPDSLKPASYAIPLEGEVLFWEVTFDEKTGKQSQRKRCFDLKSGDHLRLKRNSIVYVTLAPVLRLTNYVAARFNLTILDIYRGLLVGTGPLVDPGFVGRIHLPLHNYTSNDYDIVANEAMVWMEFTKLSPNSAWTKPVPETPDRTASFTGFPQRKLKREVISDYLKDHEPVVSSIPQLVEDARESARVAAKETRTVRNISLGAAIGVVLAMGAIVVTIYLGLNDISNEQGDLRSEIATLKAAAHRTDPTTKSRSSTAARSPQPSAGSP